MSHHWLFFPCPSVSLTLLSVGLQRTTRHRRTWRGTRRTHPTPTPSVTPCPTWGQSPGTRRNMATRSAWRQATVRIRACVKPLSERKTENIKPRWSQQFDQEVSSDWASPLKNLLITQFVLMQDLWMSRVLFYSLLPAQSWQSTFVLFLACFTFTQSPL